MRHGIVVQIVETEAQVVSWEIAVDVEQVLEM